MNDRPSRFARALGGLLVAVSVGAPAAETRADLCVRATGFTPPFAQTLRVQLTLRGAPVDDALLATLTAPLLRERLWPGRGAQVALERWTEDNCAAGGDAQASIELEISEADVDAVRGASQRGASVWAGLAELAGRATSRLQAAPATEQEKHWLRLLYASNRERKSSRVPAEAFGNERVDDLSYGAIDVAVRAQPGMRDLRSPALLKLERVTPLSDIELPAQLTPMTLEEWRAELRRRATGFDQPGVLLFIHGYNVSFTDAAQRAAQLAYDLAFPGATVFFAWPSDASTVRYLEDGRDARNSRVAAATLLRELTEPLPAGPVYLVAHSMGNRVLTEGLLELLQDDPGRRRALREVVMAAPDVDQEDFRLNIAPRLLRPGGPRFTLYASRNDLALQTSQRLQGGNRLGYGGESLYVQRGLDSVDASAVSKEFFALNHSYFGDQSTVLADLFHLIRRRLPPAERPNLRPLPRQPVSAWMF